MTALLNLEQAMEALGGIGRTTLFDLMRTGRLDTVKIGHRTLIPTDAIDAFIAANRTQQMPAHPLPPPAVVVPIKCPACGRWFRGDAGMARHAARMHKAAGADL